MEKFQVRKPPYGGTLNKVLPNRIKKLENDKTNELIFMSQCELKLLINARAVPTFISIKHVWDAFSAQKINTDKFSHICESRTSYYSLFFYIFRKIHSFFFFFFNVLRLSFFSFFLKLRFSWCTIMMYINFRCTT